MTTLKQQTDAKIAAGRQGNPAFMQGVDDIIKQAHAFQQGSNAITVGQKAPSFLLPNPQKQLIALQDLLNKGPVVVTFYRGSWCPYCNLQLKALQSRLTEIKTLGAELVAISPQIPDDSLTEDQISKMDFMVLSDQSAQIASQYGVAWEVPEFLLHHMREDRGLDLESINNGNATILPIPATFIIDKHGEVIWRFVDVDYRTRSEPEDIINVLRSL